MNDERDAAGSEESPEQEFIEAIRAVADEFDADIYLYAAGIDDAGLGGIIREFPAESPRENALLILTTNGGLANSAFQIARFFQHSYDKFTVYIPSVCKSAGTLLAIGAHQLIMGPLSELGPLDVQLLERDEIFARKSGLLMHSAMESLKRESFDLYEHFLLHIKARSGDNISFPVASQVATTIVSGVMAPVYAQISPNTIGGDYRDLRVAIEYGRRLAQVSENIGVLGIRRLTEAYPSHDFVIDILEAKGLFNNVDKPSENLYRLISFIADDAMNGADGSTILCLNPIAITSEESGDEHRNEDGENGDGTAGQGVDGGAGGDRGVADSARAEVPVEQFAPNAAGNFADNDADQSAGREAVDGENGETFSASKRA